MSASSTPIDVLAVLDRVAKEIDWQHEGMPAGLAEARAAVAPLISELVKAHQIILLALNALPPGAKRNFERKVIGAGLDGEGTTRFHERRAALATVGVQL